MALSLDIGKDTIEVVSSKDDALGITKDETLMLDGKEVLDEDGKPKTIYGAYLESLDETLLRLKTEPTRFVMRKLLGYGAAQKIKTQQAGLNAEGKVEVRMGYIMDEIRAALVGVTNPGSPSLEFKRDSDGQASKELVCLLEATGIANELYAARQGAVKVAGGAATKKN